MLHHTHSVHTHSDTTLRVYTWFTPSLIFTRLIDHFNSETRPSRTYYIVCSPFVSQCLKFKVKKKKMENTNTFVRRTGRSSVWETESGPCQCVGCPQTVQKTDGAGLLAQKSRIYAQVGRSADTLWRAGGRGSGRSGSGSDVHGSTDRIIRELWQGRLGGQCVRGGNSGSSGDVARSAQAQKRRVSDRRTNDAPWTSGDRGSGVHGRVDRRFCEPVFQLGFR